MKKFLVLFLLLLVASVASAGEVLFIKDGKFSTAADNNPLPTTQKNNGVTSMTRHVVTLATGTVSLLTEIITDLADNDIVYLQAHGNCYIDPAGTASATIQAGGWALANGDTYGPIRLKTTGNLSFIAATTATCQVIFHRFKD